MDGKVWYLLFPLAFLFHFTLHSLLHTPPIHSVLRCESANPQHKHFKKTNRDIDIFSCVEVNCLRGVGTAYHIIS